MNRSEAEDYIYESYMRAEKEWEFHEKDEKKRNPLFSRDIIRNISKKPGITITGSKGKGSVARMIASILNSSLKVGLMTSPHLVDFNERFQIGNQPISDEAFIYYVKKAKNLFDKIQGTLKKGECISPIGIQCVIALLYFGENHTDINVFEGGKGVKYDDVNNIPHDYSVMNTIFLEHTRELGSSLEEITKDKACIITGHEKCVYVAEQKKEVYEIIRQRAEEMHVPMKVYGRDFYAQNIQFTKQGMEFDVVIEKKVYENLCIPLLGEHQAKNCALALALCSQLLDISSAWDSIKNNLSCMEWPGRMEIISHEPFVLLDACINRESAYRVLDVLEKLGMDEVVTIIGIPDDKDYAGVASVLEKFSRWMILTKSTNKHYIFSAEQRTVLEKQFENKNVELETTQDILSAINLALEKNLPIVILGTTSLIADVKRMDRKFGGDFNEKNCSLSERNRIYSKICWLDC